MTFATSGMLYAAMRGADCAGVFSAKDRAADIACDRLVPVECLRLEGSPAPAQYACLAAGTQAILRRTEDGFDADHLDVGPCWGCNVQSAVAGLYGPYLDRKGLELTCLRLYEIDREYPEPPENLRAEFSFLCCPDEAAFRLSAEDLAADYIAHYLRCIAPPTEAELARQHDADLVADRLLALSIREGAQVCGMPHRRLHRRMTEAVARSFTPEELHLLAVLSGAEQDAAVSNAMLTGQIPPQTVADLLQRARACIDRHRSSGRRTRLSDYLD